jgi:hypothetical protein
MTGRASPCATLTHLRSLRYTLRKLGYDVKALKGSSKRFRAIDREPVTG